MPVGKPETVVKEDGETETVMSATLPPGLLPIHKDAVVQFMERVYGIENQMTFFRLLEEGFLPDMRAVTMLDEVCYHLRSIFYHVRWSVCCHIR